MDKDASGRDAIRAPFDARLRSLHEISLELARASDSSSLCRMAVESGISRLGFDRICIWFIDADDPRLMVGAWGTDEDGRPRDETGQRYPRTAIAQRENLYKGLIPYVLLKGLPVYEDTSHPEAVGDKAIVPLWDGQAIGGELVGDNYITRRRINDDDCEVLVLLGRTIAHLASIKRREAELKKALEAKAVLLGELEHRTKNSFALIQSLISIEARRISNRELGDTMSMLRDRVSVLASLYSYLRVSEKPQCIKLGEYLRKIAVDLLEGYGADARGLSLDFQAEPIEIDAKRAVSLGLVVNELVTDSLKHAFPEGRTGLVRIDIRRDAGLCLVAVSDDGVGLPPGFSRGGATGLGFALVGALCDQIDAVFEIGSDGSPGARFTLRFRP